MRSLAKRLGFFVGKSLWNIDMSLEKNERLVVTIDGRDKSGHFFNEQVVASRISKSGALLSGLSRPVRLGDVISVAYGGKKSRFKVVWLRDSESHHLIQAAIHLMKAESCPWAH